MDDLSWEIKYQLKRTLKHLFYLLLVICFFALWYIAFGLFTGQWNIKEWSGDLVRVYFSFSLPTGFGYALYRALT